MLCVVEDPAALFAQERHRLGDHGEVLLQADAQHLRYVEVPAFPENNDRLGTRLQKALKLRVVFGCGALPAGGPEGAEFRGLQSQPRGLVEEFHILGIAPRIPGLDPGYAQFVQGAGNREFVPRGKGYTLPLSAVTEGCVENFYRIQIRHRFLKNT